LDLEVIPEKRLKNVVCGSDIVATCTDSIEAVVQESDWIEYGVYLTFVKPNEWSPEILNECDLVLKVDRETIHHLDEGRHRIAGIAAYVAGTEAELQRIYLKRATLL